MKERVYMLVYKVKKKDKQTKKGTNNHILVRNRKISRQKQYTHNMVSEIYDKIEYTSMEETIMKIMINEINN